MWVESVLPSVWRLWCGRRESNPHRPFEPCGFSYRLRLSPPGRCCRVSGLRSGLSLHHPSRIQGLGAARLVSTPSRLLPGLARDCHCYEVSPTLSSSTPPVSQRALNFSQVRCVCHSATPAWWSDYVSIIGQDRLIYLSTSSSAVEGCLRSYFLRKFAVQRR